MSIDVLKTYQHQSASTILANVITMQATQCTWSPHHKHITLPETKNNNYNKKLHKVLRPQFYCTTKTIECQAPAETLHYEWRVRPMVHAKYLRKEACTVRPLRGNGGRKLLTSCVDVSLMTAASRVHRCSCRNDSSYSSITITNHHTNGIQNIIFHFLGGGGTAVCRPFTDIN